MNDKPERSDESTASTLAAAVVKATRGSFKQQKGLADGALAQLEDADWYGAIDDDANTVAVLVRHVAGNLRSRWTDFLTTDGEKPSRDRDDEFERRQRPVAEMLAEWEEAFGVVDRTLASLSAADLEATVTIRGEPMPALGAVQRSLAHTSHHVGQIVLLAKHARGTDWVTLSKPKRR